MAGRPKAAAAAKPAKPRATTPAALRAKAKADKARCELIARERVLRQDVRRAERLQLQLTRKHAATGVRLAGARQKCEHGCRSSSRHVRCVLDPQLRLLARQLAAAEVRRQKLAHEHAAVAAALQAAGVTVKPLEALGSRPKRSVGARQAACGTACHIAVDGGTCGAQATLKVVNIAQNPRPELIFSTAADALGGTPVVTTHRLVLGGNGRTMGVRRHYLAGGEAFRDYLVKTAHEFGFTPAQVRRFKEPVVVRVVDVPPEDYVRYVRDLNQPLTQSIDAIGEAVSLARQLSPRAIEVLGEALAGDKDLGEFFDSKASLPFIHELERSGIITQQNRARMIRSDKLLTEDGRAIVIRQISAALLPDADLLELAGPELRQALARSAPGWMAAASHLGEWDIRAPLERAVRDLIAARSSRLTVRRYFQQINFFDPPLTYKHPMGLRLLLLLEQLGGRPAVFGRVAKGFAAEADQFGGRQASMLQPKAPIAALDDAAAHFAKFDLAGETAKIAGAHG